MAYEPTSEAGKEALKQGADPTVVEEMEKQGELHEEEPEHVEKKSPKEESHAEPDEKGKEGEEESVAGDDDENDPIKHPDRTPQSMPVWKHKELLKQETEKIRAEAQTELDKALAEAATKKGGSTSEDVTKLAEDFSITPEVAEAMLDRMTTIVSDRLDLVGIKRDNEARKETDRQIAEQQGFESEWGAQATQDALKSAAGDRPITEQVKAKVKELAYTTTYAKYRLSDVIKLNLDSVFPAGKTEKRSAEGGSGGTSRGASAPKNLNDTSAADIEAMSPKEFAEFSDALGKSGSRFIRTTKS